MKKGIVEEKREYLGEVTDKYHRGRKCTHTVTDIRTILKVNVNICIYLSVLSLDMLGRRKYIFAPKKVRVRPCLISSKFCFQGCQVSSLIIESER